MAVLNSRSSLCKYNRMIALSLQSGSNGNCTYVEAGGLRLLFDAGLCGVEAERRLAAHGRDIRAVDALIISHDHADHVKYAGVYQRKFGFPLYITPKTLYRSEMRHRLGRLKKVNFFLPGERLTFGRVSVRSIPTPHDCLDGTAFVVCSDGKQLGILIDLGHPFEELSEVVASLDAVFIESNYDPGMLAAGPYPACLKRRIRGPGGHLSNREAAELLQGGTKLRWACLAHLSEKNNDAALALQTHRDVLGSKLTLHITSRHAPTGMFSV